MKDSLTKRSLFYALSAVVLALALIVIVRSSQPPNISQPNSQNLEVAKVQSEQRANRPPSIIAPTEELVRSLAQTRDALLKDENYLQAKEEILQFLASGADAPTGSPFVVGEGGTLGSAPTLRTFMLDLLGQIDPEEAAKLSAKSLASYNHPDEFVIALRNYAWGNNDVDETFKEAVSQIISRNDWLKNPTAGLLEGFDALVYAGEVSAVPRLAELVAQGDSGTEKAVSRAAFNALDQLTSSHFPDVAHLIIENDLLSTSPIIRSSLFSRANPQIKTDSAMLERYLLSERTSDAELVNFSKLFPLGTQIVGQFLFTTPAPISPSAMKQRDIAARSLIQSWLVDPRFSSKRVFLTTILQRLDKYVESSKSSITEHQ